MTGPRQTIPTLLECGATVLAICLAPTAARAEINGQKTTIRIAGGLPDPGTDPPEWRVAVLIRAGDAQLPAATPVVNVEGGRLVAARPDCVRIAAGESAVFFVHVAGAGSSTPATMTFSLEGNSATARRCQLALGLDLSRLEWETWWQGKGTRLADVRGLPPSSATYKPIHLPRLWQALGVTWVRTRFMIPASWRDKALRLKLRAIDDADACFLNGREIGRTQGWDKQRDYAIPPDAVRWGEQNDLAIAVDNVNAGGGVYRTPLLLTVGDAPETGWPFAPAVQQREAERAPPGPIGPRLPLRRMVVRDGVLRYEDGKEVALWGVNTYPQSWTQYNSLTQLGIDPRRATDEDFEDFAQMGIDIIRIHVFDTEISDGQGNLIRNDHLDVLDYLVAQCNRRNIYLMLTPIAWWGSPNQRPDSFSRNTPKQAMSMWPDRWPAQANYLKQFLTHTNPHTGRRLADEPCLALFEVINEPTYWTFGDIISGEPGITHLGPDVSKRGLAGVRSAWQAFLPSDEWQCPAVFACFRYDTLRRYVNTMIDAIRSTGARQPIAYSTFDAAEVEIAQAVADSRCDAVTLGAYPGGLRRINDDRNLLGETRNGTLDARFAGKARLVYEFDAAGMVKQVCMYPAMARRWRNLGVQVACQFQYDARSLAHLNRDWHIHYLNLWHTPGKMVSFLIGGEVFRRLARGATFPTPDDDQVFAPAAVSFRRNAALLCARDCYMQAGPTDWRPLPIPDRPTHVCAVGACPYFEYDGTGVVDLRIRDGRADLRIHPDVERLREGLTGTPDKPLTRLHQRERPFRLRLPGWSDAKVKRLEKGAWQGVNARPGDFPARPGVYRLTK